MPIQSQAVLPAITGTNILLLDQALLLAAEPLHNSPFSGGNYPIPRDVHTKMMLKATELKFQTTEMPRGNLPLNILAP